MERANNHLNPVTSAPEHVEQNLEPLPRKGAVEVLGGLALLGSTELFGKIGVTKELLEVGGTIALILGLDDVLRPAWGHLQERFF